MSLSRPLRLECTGQCAAEARCNKFCWAGSYTCRSMGRKTFATVVSKTLCELDGVLIRSPAPAAAQPPCAVWLNIA